MKKIAVFIVFLVFILTPNLNSIAAQKSNIACLKEGTKKKSNNITFRCKQTSSGLVWEKVVKMKNQKPYPKKIQTQFEILANQNSITGQALNEFNLYSPIEKSRKSPAKYVFSPNSDLGYQEFIKALVEKSFGYFADFYKDERQLLIVYGTVEDLDWLLDYLKSNNLVKSELLDEYRESVKESGEKTNRGGSDTWGDGRNQINILRGNKNPKVGEADRAFIAHEFVHALQNDISGAQENIPCWTAEGAASFFGNAISAKYYQGDYIRLRYWNLQMVGDASKKLFPWTYSDDQWIDAFKRLEKRGDLCSFDARISYGIGIAMTELMVADKGITTLMEWWSTGKTSEGWRNGFKRLYESDLDVWYLEKALPYVKEVYAANTPDKSP